MLSGIKFLSRDQVEKESDNVASTEKKRRSSSKKENTRRRNKSSYDVSSSSGDDIGKIKKQSRKKKSWYSDEYSSEYSSGSGSEGSLDQSDKKRSRRKKGKKHHKKSYQSEEDREITRKKMGLDWMLKPSDKVDKGHTLDVDDQPEKTHLEEIKRVNPRELNPYLKDNGSGYPDEVDEKRVGKQEPPSSSIVGDGGASWRLKALKRAQEQAAREGKKLEQVVEERWGSLGQLTVSAASHVAAPARAHLHAIKNRQRGKVEENQTDVDGQYERDANTNAERSFLKDASARHPEMRAPKSHDSLSWRKRKSQNLSSKDADIISCAASSLNKFANDGSFMSHILSQQTDPLGYVSSEKQYDMVESKVIPFEMKKDSEGTTSAKEALSANQLAAKALQLRMKGKYEEADKLMEEAEKIKVKEVASQSSKRSHEVVSNNRYAVQATSGRRKEDDADRHLAQKIMQNKQYSLSSRAEDEYDFEDGPSRKSRKKGKGNDQNSKDRTILTKRILTQQERCLFCFENPNRPKHLVVSIANFTYLMLPQSQSVVPGHCCILTLQHESATRTVDDNVWEEIRNFKKCLIMMFAKQEKEVVFLETVMDLAKQRRHCLIECIPLPQDVAKQAPLYFKKAIDEAEDEWSQHNAKKLIDTSQKGLRSSIPKDFPYFHVEFGLNKGFVHVIDDEQQFKSSLGLNVIRGMLRLPEEDMYRRRRHESVDTQRQAVADFTREWEPFDWTKQLN